MLPTVGCILGLGSLILFMTHGAHDVRMALMQKARRFAQRFGKVHVFDVTNNQYYPQDLLQLCMVQFGLGRFEFIHDTWSARFPNGFRYGGEGCGACSAANSYCFSRPELPHRLISL